MREDQNQPMDVLFYCEDCAIEFEQRGTVEQTGFDGGVVYVPIDPFDEVVYCPNDIAGEVNIRPTHDISLVGAA